MTKLRTLPLFQQNTQTECVRHWIYTKSGFRFVYAKYMSGFFPSLYRPLFVRNVRFIEYINRWQKHWCFAAVVVVVWGYMSSWIECASTLVHWVGLEPDKFREKLSFFGMFKFFLHFFLNYPLTFQCYGKFTKILPWNEFSLWNPPKNQPWSKIGYGSAEQSTDGTRVHLFCM